MDLILSFIFMQYLKIKIYRKRCMLSDLYVWFSDHKHIFLQRHLYKNKKSSILNNSYLGLSVVLHFIIIIILYIYIYTYIYISPWYISQHMLTYIVYNIALTIICIF